MERLEKEAEKENDCYQGGFGGDSFLREEARA